MEAAPPQSLPAAAASRCGSSLSIRSDGSDFEFNSCEFSSNEPPVSPKLHSISPTWERSASRDLISPSLSPPRRLCDAASPPHQAAVAYGRAEDFASIKIGHEYYEDDHPNGQQIGSADGLFGRRSLDSMQVALNKKHASLSSLILHARDAHQLPVRASSCIPIISYKTANRGSPASDLESSQKSSPVFSAGLWSKDHNGKRRRRWSFSLDFWHSTPLSSSNKLDNCHRYMRCDAVKIGKANAYGAAGFTEAHKDRCESPQKSASGSSSRLISRPQLAIKREKTLINTTATKQLGKTGNSTHSASSPVSPGASPSRTAAAGDRLHLVGYGNSSLSSPLPMKKPMSPHAQHYEQQRARAQQLSRRTFLPYRHNLLASCFFSSSQPVASH